MKKLKLMFLVACFTINGLATSVGGDPMEVLDQDILAEYSDKAFQPWFDGLRSGDLISLRPLLSAEAYSEYRTLFEENAHYSQFLRDFYAGASFQLVRLLNTKEGYLGEAVVFWPDGSSTKMALLASYADDSGQIKLRPQ